MTTDDLSTTTNDPGTNKDSGTTNNLSTITMDDFMDVAVVSANFVATTVKIHPHTWKQLKIMAITERSTLTGLINEGLAVYIKWLKKAERLEAASERSVELDRQIGVQEKIIREVQFQREKENRQLLRRRKVRVRLPSRVKYPGMLRKPKFVEKLTGEKGV